MIVAESSFDTNLFGFSVGKLEVENDSKLIEIQGALRQAYSSGIKLVFLFAPSIRPGSDPSKAELPGICVDDKTTYSLNISSIFYDELQRTSMAKTSTVRISNVLKASEVSEEVRMLAVSAGEFSRFRIDPNIPRFVNEAMFGEWIKNSVNRTIADDIFVAQDVTSREIIGLITVKMKDSTTGNIGLLAVSSQHRRKGIASLLLRRAVLWCLEQAAWSERTVLTVVTQGANRTACSCYEQFGFEVVATQKVFHVWLPQHLEEPKLVSDQGPIPFCKQFMTGNEKTYVNQVLSTGLDSAARFTTMCSTRLKEIFGEESQRVVMVTSGTAALEMAALLADLQPGDEVIMPSYTFSSTANAFVLRGCVPVFVDVRMDTVNMDEARVEAAVGPRTRAICAVHYAGLPCEMDTICEIAQRHNLIVIEDAAQGFLSTYKGRQLGTIGHFGCFSFHYTKNVMCGEGGAISVNRLASPEMVRRSLVLWEKGTNRYDFVTGKVDKYEWVDYGSSYVPNELSSAVLWAQLEQCHEITARRVENFRAYSAAFADLVSAGRLAIPAVPEGCSTNGHIFFVILPSRELRDRMAAGLKRHGVTAFSHYVPLHSSPAGRRFGRVSAPQSQHLTEGGREIEAGEDLQLTSTDAVFDGLLRLPVWADLRPADVQHVVASLRGCLEEEQELKP